MITGTAFNRVQLRRLAGDHLTPELVQAAAFTAAVEPDQQAEVRALVTERLRANNRWRGEMDEILFGQLFEDASNAHAAVGVTDEVIGGAVGGVLGLLTGKPSMGIAGSLAGGSIGLPIVEAYVEVVVDQFLDAALDDLIGNPCQVTAGQVLERVRADP
ncbi:MAG: hypothetical protein ACREJ0_17110 [Geminicoccaceae bacterium]